MLPLLLLSANLMVGDCLGWAERPDGWTIVYRINKIGRKTFRVTPLVSDVDDITPANKPWFIKRIRRDDKDFTKVPCPYDKPD